jgi:hypothetical protein
MEDRPIPGELFGHWIINLADFPRVRHKPGGYAACRSYISVRESALAQEEKKEKDED